MSWTRIEIADEFPSSRRRGVFITWKKITCGSGFILGIVVALCVGIYYSCKQMAQPLSSSKVKGAGILGIGITKFEEENDGETLFDTNTTTHNNNSKHKLLLSKQDVGRRIPSALNPLSYTVVLLPFLNGNLSLHGQVNVTFEVLITTKRILLHAKQLIIDQNAVKVTKVEGAGKDGNILKVSTQHYVQGTDFYAVITEETLTENFIYSIFLDYTGVISNNNTGLYYYAYRDDRGYERRQLRSQFAPSNVRRVFPCFDEPNFKANFTFIIARERNLSTIFSTPLTKMEPAVGLYGYYWDTSETTLKLPAHLLAIFISNFIPFERGERLKVWSRKSLTSNMEFAQTISRKSMAFLESYLQKKFAFSKLDIIAAAQVQKDSIHTGFLLVRDADVCLELKTSSARSIIAAGKVISRVIAEQWFIEATSHGSWRDKGLIKGLVTYLNYKSLYNLEDAYENIFIVEDHLKALGKESLAKKLSAHLSSIAARGTSVWRMLEQILTEAVFRSGLSAYINRNADENDISKLWQHWAMGLQNEGVSLTQFIDSWTMQNGYPLLSVMKGQKGEIFLLQEEFNLHQSLHKDANITRKKWYIPISHVHQQKPDFSQTRPTEWLTPDDGIKLIYNMPTTGWTIFNVQHTGFYRVNYDYDNWEAISQQLLSDHRVINVRNRAQALDDSLYLARAGKLSYNVALRVLSYIEHEDEYLPWFAAMSNLNYIRRMLWSTPMLKSFQRYCIALMTPIYEKLTFEESNLDNLQTKLLRSLILENLCRLQYSPCEGLSTTLFNLWRADTSNTSIMIPNSRRVILCSAIKNGGVTEWNFLWEMYKKIRCGSLKEDYLWALSCTTNGSIVEAFLHKLLETSGEVQREMKIAFLSLVQEENGQTVALNFINNYWTSILIRSSDGADDLVGIVTVIAESVGEQQNINVLEQLRRNRRQFPYLADDIEDAVLVARTNVAWKEAFLDIFTLWLR